jgi:hypothetical protein
MISSMKKSDLVAVGCAFLTLIYAESLDTTVMYFYLVGVVFVVGRIGWSINILSILVLIGGFKALEILLVPVVWEYSNYVIYSTWFLLDLILYVFIMYRAPAVRLLVGTKNADDICFTNADLTLGWVHLLHCGASLLSLIEHSLRHLDDFGVPASIPLVQWLNSNAVVIYYSYKPFQVGLNIIEVSAVFATAGRYMRSARFLNA